LLGAGVVGALACLAGLLVITKTGETAPITVPSEDISHRHLTPNNLSPRIKTMRVDPSGDLDKAGSVHGVMAWRFFEVPVAPSERCEEELRFKFTAPARILQIDLSIDINDPRLNLVEFAAGINSTEGYGQYRSADWLMQASWSRRPLTPGEIDETVTLPPGVEVARGDFVGITCWMGGVGRGDPLRVSPEVIVLYRWL
jgi:hypothetical protein